MSVSSGQREEALRSSQWPSERENTTIRTGRLRDQLGDAYGLLLNECTNTF